MKTKDLEILKICVNARPGCHIEDGLREAIILSIAEGVIVEYTHNNKTFRIDPEVIMKTVKSK